MKFTHRVSVTTNFHDIFRNTILVKLCCLASVDSKENHFLYFGYILAKKVNFPEKISWSRSASILVKTIFLVNKLQHPLVIKQCSYFAIWYVSHNIFNFGRKDLASVSHKTSNETAIVDCRKKLFSCINIYR